jgi:hypothetical protein
MDKQLAYLMGYFYADGYLKKTKGKWIYPALEIVKNDGENIITCLDNLKIKYGKNYRFRKNSKNEQLYIRISAADTNIELFKKILSDKINMSNILNYITNDDLPYFLRGFFDGDGCINISKNNSCRLYFYGAFLQDWEIVFNVLKKLDIKYTYQQIIRKNGKHKSTHIIISNKYGINILYEYLYPDRIYDFGLLRKYEKLNMVKGLIKSNHIKKYIDNKTVDKIKTYKNC